MLSEEKKPVQNKSSEKILKTKTASRIKPDIGEDIVDGDIEVIDLGDSKLSVNSESYELRAEVQSKVLCRISE